jgi:hypothetical protein
LLSGTFLGAVFTGYGSAGSIVDSVLGGGLVDYNSNPLLAFAAGGDEGLSLALTGVNNPVVVSGGKLSDFAAVSQGSFAAVNVSVDPPVPEPSTWAMMLAGFAGLAFAAYRRTKARPAIA